MDPAQQPQPSPTPFQPLPNDGSLPQYPEYQSKPTDQQNQHTYQIPTSQQPPIVQPQTQYPQPQLSQNYPIQPNYQVPQETPSSQIQPQTISYEQPQAQPEVQAVPPPPQPIVDPTYQTYVNYYYQQQQQDISQPSYPVPQETPSSQIQPQTISYEQPQAQPTTLPHNSIQPNLHTASTEDTAIQSAQLTAPTNTTYEIPSQSQPQAINTVLPSSVALPNASQPVDITDKLKNRLDSKDKRAIPSKLKPFIGAALAGILIFAIFNSQLLVGQLQYLISPKAGADAPSITESSSISSEPVVIIPKINVNAPVVYDVTSFDEAQVQKALERGVVHYGTTALPGQAGNNVIVGHSSNNWWASGKYKFAFVLLDKLEKGDTFELHYQGKKYVYEVFEKKVVQPNDVSVLSQTAEPITTLITCTPPGTSWQRLVVQGKQISPSPTEATALATPNVSTDKSLLPSNTPSFWQQIKERFFGGSGGN